MDGTGGRRDFRPASPRAKRAARESGISLATVDGTGPGGRIVEADVLHFVEGGRRAVSQVPETVRMTPVARRMAAEANAPIGEIRGTGPSGRITREDLLAALPASTAESMAIQSSASGTEGLPGAGRSLEPGLTGHVVPLGRKRRVTAEKMALSARTVARITLTLEADMAEVIKLREDLSPTYERQHGVHLSYNDLLVLVVARALREHPHLNARWTQQGILLIDQVNVGVAVAVEDGLVVPVVKDAQTKTLAEIASSVEGLLSRAREGRLSLEDITGGTFTITNLGMFGIESFAPLVNPPEAAILGVGKIEEKPVVRGGQIVARPRMALALSVDHRVVDGAPAAQFLVRVQQLLEMPFLLL